MKEKENTGKDQGKQKRELTYVISVHDSKIDLTIPIPGHRSAGSLPQPDRSCLVVN